MNNNPRIRELEIRFLHKDPMIAARYYKDRHVPKGILEVIQALDLVHYRLDGPSKIVQFVSAEVPLRFAMKEHPVVLWAMDGSENYDWLFNHGVALIVDHKARFDSDNVLSGIHDYLKDRPQHLPVTRECTSPPLCMPEKYHLGDPVSSYQWFYFNGKDELAKWTSPASVPTWWIRYEKRYGKRRASTHKGD